MTARGNGPILPHADAAALKPERGLPAFMDQTIGTVFVIRDEPQLEKWQHAVTKDFHPLRVVFAAAGDQRSVHAPR